MQFLLIVHDKGTAHEHCLTKDRGKLDTYFSGNRSAGPLLRAPPYMFIRSASYCQSAVYLAWWQQLIYGFQPLSLPPSAFRSLIFFNQSSRFANRIKNRAEQTVIFSTLSNQKSFYFMFYNVVSTTVGNVLDEQRG